LNRSALLGTLLLLLLASVPMAAAKPDIPVAVNQCDGNNVCLVAQTDPLCAGVGLGLQGIGACARENCVSIILGTRETVCLESTNAPDYCRQYGICGGPIVVVDDEGACAGYGGPYGGTAACVRPDGDVCVITAGEFWYRVTCVSDYLA
jgi:hypothetical protein